MSKYLSRSELRDKYQFFQAQIGFHQNQLRSADRGYYARKAARLDDEINGLIIQRDAFLAKQDSLTSQRDVTEIKIAGYQAEKAKIAFLLSKRGAGIFKMLDELPTYLHDDVFTAILSAAEDKSVDIMAVLERIFKRAREDKE